MFNLLMKWPVWNTNIRCITVTAQLIALIRNYVVHIINNVDNTKYIVVYVIFSLQQEGT